MNRIASVLLSVSALLSPFTVVAHEGHDHDESITQMEAGSVSDNVLAGLVKNKELDAAWAGGKRTVTREQRIKGKVVWITTYEKPTADGKGKESLYIFIDAVGNYLDANKTGKL
jgi:hypothetical protein